MRLIELDQIRSVLPSIDLIAVIEAGLVAYSEGRCVVPPVGELLFERPPGEVHIKYGYVRGEPYYVIKIAAGFSDNPKLGLASSSGMMLLFSQATGMPLALLHDRCVLTDIRTAAAGAIVAKHLGPRSIERIGIVGTGTQARLQLEHLSAVSNCRNVCVWGRRQEALDRYRGDFESRGYAIETTRDARELAERCRLIVTTTAARAPLLQAEWIQPGTHITAVGSDTPDKQELDPRILGRADRVVADSISQCRWRGEIAHALRRGVLEDSAIVELGGVIAGSAPGRRTAEEITVADLTGVAVQDLKIAAAVYDAITGPPGR